MGILDTFVFESKLVQVSFIVLSVLLSAYISLVYLRKMVDQLFREIGTENTFRKSIILCLVTNIPKTVLILANLQNGIDDNASLTNGMSILNLTLFLPVLVLQSPKICYINHNSFLKDFLFVNLTFLYQFTGSPTLPPLIPLACLGTFVFFVGSVLKLPESLSSDSLSGISQAVRFQWLSEIFQKTFKRIYDIGIVDLEGAHKFAGALNWRLLASPVFNALILINYHNLWKEDRIIILSLLTAFILGVVLTKASKTTGMLSLLYVYGLAASIFHIYLFFPAYIHFLKTLSVDYNLNINYLRTVFLPGLVSVMEIFTLLYYSSTGQSTLAICSLLYSTIFTMLFLKPVVNLIAYKTNSIYMNGLVDCNYFCNVFGLISSIVIMFNYVVRNHRVSKDLSYVLLFTYFFFNVSLLMDFRTYVINH